jgi:hypothetical protein
LIIFNLSALDFQVNSAERIIDPENLLMANFNFATKLFFQISTNLSNCFERR